MHRLGRTNDKKCCSFIIQNQNGKYYRRPTQQNYLLHKLKQINYLIDKINPIKKEKEIAVLPKKKKSREELKPVRNWIYN